jgi:hypothetical protein
MVHRLVGEEEVRVEVRRQVANLGDYLAEHGYFLVRPCGGFAYRGSAGVLPALEFPFGRVFERITGDRFRSRTDFVGVLKKAGVWDCVEGEWNWAGVETVALALLFPLQALYLETLGFGLEPFGDFIPWVKAHFVAIQKSSHCFDVEKPEFGLGYLLSTIDDPRRRFSRCLDAMIASPRGSWANGFVPYIGLPGLDDVDPTVRQYYLHWLNTGGTGKAPYDTEFEVSRKLVALANAVVLGAGGDREEELAELLSQYFQKLQQADSAGERWFDFPVYISNGGNPDDEGLYHFYERADDGMNFMTALALAWFHAHRNGSPGRNLPHFPSRDACAAWPSPAVPSYVFNDRSIILPRKALRRRDLPDTVDADVELFAEDDPPRKPDDMPRVAVELETDPKALRRGREYSITVVAKDRDTGDNLSEGRVAINDGEFRYSLNQRISAFPVDEDLNVLIDAPPYWDISASRAVITRHFRVPRSRMMLSLCDRQGRPIESVAEDEPFDVIVNAVDELDGGLVEGEITIVNPGRMRSDPKATQPPGGPSVEKPRTNELFRYIFRSKPIPRRGIVVPTCAVRAKSYEDSGIAFVPDEIEVPPARIAERSLIPTNRGEFLPPGGKQPVRTIIESTGPSYPPGLSSMITEIPAGTFGQDGKIAIWAYGQDVGLRLVKLRWFGDQILASVCGEPAAWAEAAFDSVSLSGRQLEYCSGDTGGFIAAYVGTKLIVAGHLGNNVSQITLFDEVDIEVKWRNFCIWP